MALSVLSNPLAGLFPPGKRPILAHWPPEGVVNRKRMQIFYSGNVQGVGFRYTVKTVATGFEVTGTVRNLADGQVELVAEGQKDELEAFRQGIREAGLEHFIAKEQASWDDATGKYHGFEIVR
jgi:acylphosphatase